MKKNRELIIISLFLSTHNAIAMRNYSDTYEVSGQVTPTINSYDLGKKFKETWLSSIAHKQNPTQKEFLFGLSSSAYQIEGGLDKYNATADFYRSKKLPLAGNAIDFWHKYATDIAQMKNELGINSFRLTIAWDRIEQKRGKFNREAIEHYKRIIQQLKNNNIEPIVVLHHYTIPKWFAKLGGFENQNNNIYFVRFAEEMYKNLQKDITYWATFNAPEAYAIKAYQEGENTPGKKDKVLTQKVLAHMLEAHVAAYKTIKSLYKENTHLPNPQIGIIKNLILFDRSYGNKTHYYLSPVSGLITTVADTLQNKLFFDFFSTGRAHLSIGPKEIASVINASAPESLDWIGLNFYSNMNMFLTKPQEEKNPEYMTENPRYRDYPEGLERAVKVINDTLAQPLNIPIIITENGIATANTPQGEEKRKRFFNRALENIRQLLSKGYPVIGYLPWSSHDSYEWPSTAFPHAFGTRNYGFFHVNFDTSSPNYLKRTLKPSSKGYRDFIRGYYGIKPTFTQQEYEAQMPKPLIGY